MPRVLRRFREGVKQVSRVDNKNTALPETLSNSRRVNVKDVVLDIPSPASTATDQDRLGKRRIENLNETVQVFEELIRQVVLDLVVSHEEVIERPDTNKHTTLPSCGCEALDPFEQVTKLATAMSFGAQSGEA